MPTSGHKTLRNCGKTAARGAHTSCHTHSGEHVPAGAACAVAGHQMCFHIVMRQTRPRWGNSCVIIKEMTRDACRCGVSTAFCSEPQASPRWGKPCMLVKRIRKAKRETLLQASSTKNIFYSRTYLWPTSMGFPAQEQISEARRLSGRSFIDPSSSTYMLTPTKANSGAFDSSAMFST